jgi:chromosome segregation ATPase
MNNLEDTKEQQQQQQQQIPKPKTNTKDELIANIKEWIKMDNEITKLKAEVKDKTNKKKGLTETLVTIMKGNSIDCFDINGGALVYKKRKTKQSISGKFLLAQLEEYYKEQPELAKEITKKVLDNRVEVFKDEIKRKIDK